MCRKALELQWFSVHAPLPCTVHEPPRRGIFSSAAAPAVPPRRAAQPHHPPQNRATAHSRHKRSSVRARSRRRSSYSHARPASATARSPQPSRRLIPQPHRHWPLPWPLASPLAPSPSAPHVRSSIPQLATALAVLRQASAARPLQPCAAPTHPLAPVLIPHHGSGSIHIAPGCAYSVTEPSSTTAANFFGETCTNPSRAGTCAGFLKSSTLDVLVGGG